MNKSHDNEGNGEYNTPYDEANQVNSPLADKTSTTAMILGIIAIACITTGFLAPVALVLGIIALVKGKNYRLENTSAKAGYILGIISVILATILIIGFAFLLIRGIGCHSMRYDGYGTRSFMNGRMHGSEFYQNGNYVIQRFF